jgi:curved DNA-binding protein CbpA
MDPYRILGVQPGFTLEELTVAYKRATRQHHPDRGGSKDLMDIATAAFRHLYRGLVMTQKKKRGGGGRPSRQSSSSSSSSSSTSSSDEDAAIAESLRRGPDGFDRKRFNEAFERCRTRTVYDDGYGDMMTGRPGGPREELKVTPCPRLQGRSQKGFGDAFNSEFERNVACHDMQLGPDLPGPLDPATSLSYVELGEGKMSDFSHSTRGGLCGTDFRRAVTTQRLCDPARMRPRRSYANYDELKADREAAASLEMSAAERRALEESERRFQAEEEARTRNMRDMDRRYEAGLSRFKSLLKSTGSRARGI